MVVCSHCGRESRGHERFCIYCGEPLNLGDHAADDGGQPPEPTIRTGPVDADAGDDDSQRYAPQAASTVAVAMTGPLSRLIVRRASTDGDQREYVLDGRDVAIGRSPSCDIVLDGDQLASRRHALLRARNGGYVVVDLGSSNGTYVNGYEIREATPLSDGDRIAVGSFEVLYATTGLPGPNASLPREYGGFTPPAVPPGRTEPYLSHSEDGVALDAPAAPADQSPTPSENGVATPDSESAGASLDAEAEQATTSAALPAVQPEVAAEPLAESQPTTEAQPAEDRPAESDVPPVSRAESKTAPLSSAAARELEALRMQLDDIATALTRKADDEAYIAGQLRAMMVDMRDELGALIQRHAPDNRATDAVDQERLGELVTVARQAAENPRHLDYLTSLSAHAGAIADALETARPVLTSGAVPADELEALRARVNDILGQFPPIS